MVVLSFSVIMAFFLLIGALSVRESKNTNKDYLVAGRNVSPWLVALSAVSTNNSGYMFIGQIGFTYLEGLSSIWLMIGWITGDFIMSLFVHRKLREISGQKNILSFGGLIAKWWGADYRKVRFLVGVITVIFLGTYAAAQFKAGGKALNVLFGWSEYTGILLGAVMVTVYCFAGGIRASIWTDAAQSIVMIVAMGMLMLFAINAVGGLEAFIAKTDAVSPHYLSWFPDRLKLGTFVGPFLFVLGWLFAGFGIIGQPHIMIRLMTLDKADNINAFRAYYYSWYVAFYLLAIGVGLASRVLLPDVSGFDPELALPTLSSHLLPSILVGVILAGIFAATMSTADSQILSCSAAFTRDIFPSASENYWLTKGTTLFIALVATVIAIFGGQNVFSLVLMAWSVLSAAFAPILILYALNRRINERTLIAMIVAGVTATLVWRHLGWGQYIYEIAPGILMGFVCYGVFHLFGLNEADVAIQAELSDPAA